MDVDHIEYLTFDCYGTLIDWEAGILAVLRPLLAAKRVALDDRRILETYAELEAEAETGQYVTYRQVLAVVVNGFGERFGFQVSSDDRHMMVESVGQWPAFSDAVESLSRLATRFRLVVLSNIDDDLFAGSSRRLGNPFHTVITAEQVGSYKPSLVNFRYAIDTLGGDPARIVHVAQSLYHDIGPAKKLGLQTVWVNRRLGREGPGATPPAEAQPDLEFPSLAAFADYVS